MSDACKGHGAWGWLNRGPGAVFGMDRMICMEDAIDPGIERAGFTTSRVSVDRCAGPFKGFRVRWLKGRHMFDRFAFRVAVFP